MRRLTLSLTLFLSLSSEISYAEIPVIRDSAADPTEFKKYIESSPGRISYAKSVLTKKIDPATNLIIDQCLDLQYSAPQSAEESCEKSLHELLLKPMNKEARDVSRELLRSLNQKFILRKNRKMWESLQRTLEAKVTIGSSSSQIEIRRAESWLRQMQSNSRWQDLRLLVNGDPLENLNTLSLQEVYQWTLLSEAYLEKTVVGSFAELEKIQATDLQVLQTGSCERSDLSFTEKEGREYEVFFSHDCQKLVSSQIELFPSYKMGSSEKMPLLEQRESHTSWVVPLAVTGLVLGLLWLKDKNVSLRWGL